jgi:hypothetical protein
LLGNLGERVFAGFSRFPGVGVIFGTAVMARRTGRRDRGVRGIPGRWPTAALGRRAQVLAWVRAVPAGFAARASGREGGTTARVWRVIELGWTVLKIRMLY